jgi:aerobic C4-dicarboxylate transport protein
MKLWFRYLVGTAIGVVAGILIPLAGGDTLSVLEELTDILVRAGRLLLFPMAFFAVIIAVDELRDDRRVWAVTLKTAVLALGAVLVAVVVAVVVMAVFQPQRIPPMVQEAPVPVPPQLGEVLRRSLPLNGFQIFVLGENALAMILLLGALIGWTLRYDREITSPVSLVSDSANRIFYRLNGGLTSVLGFLLAIPAGMMIVRIRELSDLQLFGQFLIVVATAAVLVGVVLYPLALYLMGRDVRVAVEWLSRMGAPSLAALLGGDVYFATPTLVRVAKEELHVPRRVGGSVSYLVAVFSRAGSVLVAVAAFLLVIRSYTALEIGFGETLGVAVTAVLVSFLLGRTPAGGVTVLLSYLAVAYGRGMDESYLILLPVLPLLERLGAWLDVMTHGFIAFAVADSEGIRHRG